MSGDHGAQPGNGIGLTGLVEQGEIRALHALLVENAAAGRERAKRPDRLLQETEQTPAADSTTSS